MTATAQLSLGEGSNEIQQLVIARRLFERYDGQAR
jgi:alkylation response protein AidB-like acyl-CoA dehydrogenase